MFFTYINPPALSLFDNILSGSREQMEKHKKLIQEIEEMEKKLKAMVVEASGTEDDENLESFASLKGSGQILDKLEFKKIKVSLGHFRARLVHNVV